MCYVRELCAWAPLGLVRGLDPCPLHPINIPTLSAKNRQPQHQPLHSVCKQVQDMQDPAFDKALTLVTKEPWRCEEKCVQWGSCSFKS